MPPPITIAAMSSTSVCVSTRNIDGSDGATDVGELIPGKWTISVVTTAMAMPTMPV
jgi:hypothetical protein